MSSENGPVSSESGLVGSESGPVSSKCGLVLFVQALMNSTSFPTDTK